MDGVLENIKELLFILVSVIMALCLYFLKKLSLVSEVYWSIYKWNDMMTGILFNIPPRLKLKAKVAGSIHEVRLENGNDGWGRRYAQGELDQPQKDDCQRLQTGC